MRILKVVVIGAAALMLTAGEVNAQQPASGLQYLVGTSVGTTGYQMQQRVYTRLRNEKTSTDIWDYWRDRNGRCVTVHSSNARVYSLVYAPGIDCGTGQATGGGDDYGHDYDEAFDTVCGVVTGGQVYRYRCQAKDYYSGRHRVATDLRFPDNFLRMVWKGGNRVALMFEGMATQYSTFNVNNGETTIPFEDKTYFFLSDRHAAREALQNYR